MKIFYMEKSILFKTFNVKVKVQNVNRFEKYSFSYGSSKVWFVLKSYFALNLSQISHFNVVDDKKSEKVVISES